MQKRVELGNIFSFSETDGVVCKICADAKSTCDFAVEKVLGSVEVRLL